MIEEFVEKYRREILKTLLCLAIIGILGLIIGGSFRFLSPPLPVQADVTTTIGVTAVVEAWLDFVATPTSVTLQPALVLADGTLNVGSSTAIDLQVGTNSIEGWNVKIRGENAGLFSPTATHTISTVSGTSTIATGTEAYGANATSTLSGVSIGSYYDYYGTDTVGEIASSTDHTLAQKDSPNSTQSVVNMKIKATAAATTPPANNYGDTITLTASTGLP